MEQYIRGLPLSWADKKQMLIAWCDCAGVKVTAEKVARVCGVTAGVV